MDFFSFAFIYGDSNSIFSEFFRQGQVLETFRGKGIYQPAVDTAIEKLNKGEWVRDTVL